MNSNPLIEISASGTGPLRNHATVSEDLAAVFAEQRAVLWKFLARRVNESSADDLVQETFIKANRAWAAFEGNANPRTWLRQIARNTALDFLRSRSHRQTLFNDPIAHHDDGTGILPELAQPAVGALGIETHEMHVCVREYVARLAPGQRQILELKDLQGLTNSEIALRLGITIDATKIRLHRARAALRKELEGSCEFYQSDAGTLSCDRREPVPVSLGVEISSKEVTPLGGARCSDSDGRDSSNIKTMSSPNSCGCSSSTNSDSCNTESLFTPIAAEFVALGAAIGANCEPCLQFHVREAQKLGISLDDIARAVALAEQVKATPARNLAKLAERLTKPNQKESTDGATPCGCG